MRGLVLKGGLLIVAVAGFFTLFSVSSPTKAQAASCGVNTGKESSYAGLIIDMYWWPYTGGTYAATGVAANVNMTDTRGDADPYGNIIYANWTPYHNGWQYPITASNNETFNEDTSACSDGHNIVLGYFQGSSTTSYSTNPNHPGPWFLDCDASQFGVGNERIFTITGVGVPSGARGGGSWEAKSFRAVNGSTVYMTLAYREPPPPPPPPPPGTMGYLDVTNCNQIAGWAFDPNNSSASIDVHAYYNAPAGSASPPLLGAVAHTANLARPDVNAAFGISGNHGYSFTPDFPNVNSAITVYIYAISTTGGPNTLIGSQSYGPCAVPPPVVTPQSFVSPGGPVSTDQPITFSHSLVVTGYTGNKTYQQSLYLEQLVDTTSGPGGWTNIKSDTINITGNGTISVYSSTQPPPPNTARICQRLYLGGGDVAVTSSYSTPACVTVGHKPYFRAEGGDVVAGAGFTASNGTCNLTANAIIRSWNQHDTSYYGAFGAGTELAAIAMGDISGFATNTFSNGFSSYNPGNVYGASESPTDLAFANTVTPIGHIGDIACMPDYYATASAQAQVMPGTSIDSWPSGVYKYTNSSLGNLNFPSNDGRNLTLLVNGNLYINGNIKYNPASDISKIPRLTVIVKGDIYIDKSVTELHGAYIAEAGSSGTGTVYTCTTGPAPAANNYSDCNSQLNIYGAVAAQNLNLGRSYGNLPDRTQAAESFRYTPELWLGGGLPLSDNNIGYDSETSLPPTL